MNPIGCKVCAHDALTEIEQEIAKGTTYKEIVSRFQGLSITNISTHKRYHMPSSRLSAPRIDPVALDQMPSPDVVKIVERQVNKFEMLERQYELTPVEERDRARYIEFLIKITLARLEAKSKVDDYESDEMKALYEKYGLKYKGV